ncbi:hypothetical protein AA103193_1408 [Tanticharoenia sakaeratensis NBRC 103193]|jgi:hypothetical protein|nr:hypothetical protein AA103193_1408 [Tanticharoenia sakaeratensis NBRC 103193]
MLIMIMGRRTTPPNTTRWALWARNTRVDRQKAASDTITGINIQAEAGPWAPSDAAEHAPDTETAMTSAVPAETHDGMTTTL